MADKIYFVDGKIVLYEDRASDKIYFVNGYVVYEEALGGGESPTAPLWMSWFD